MLAFRCLGDYARERLGVTAHAVRGWARVWEALAGLPQLRAAVLSSEISWSVARRAVAHASPETDEAFAAALRGRTVLAAEAMLRAAFRPKAPGEAAFAGEAAEAGEALPVWECAEDIAAEALGALRLRSPLATRRAMSSPSRLPWRRPTCFSRLSRPPVCTSKPRSRPGRAPRTHCSGSSTTRSPRGWSKERSSATTRTSSATTSAAPRRDARRGEIFRPIRSVQIRGRPRRAVESHHALRVPSPAGHSRRHPALQRARAGGAHLRAGPARGRAAAAARPSWGRAAPGVRPVAVLAVRMGSRIDRAGALMAVFRLLERNVGLRCGEECASPTPAAARLRRFAARTLASVLPGASGSRTPSMPRKEPGHVRSSHRRGPRFAPSKTLLDGAANASCEAGPSSTQACGGRARSRESVADPEAPRKQRGTGSGARVFAVLRDLIPQARAIPSAAISRLARRRYPRPPEALRPNPRGASRTSERLLPSQRPPPR